ncbi:MAG: hypothetical protein AAB367_01275 [Patescibacteria group bacterium]
MNTKILFAIIGGVIVVGGAFFLMKNSRNADPLTNNQNTMMNKRTSLKALMMLDTPQRCTFTNKVQNSESFGTVYLMNGRMRGDFTSVAAGRTEQSHMIVESDAGFVWADSMQGKGMMMDMSQWGQQTNNQNTQQVDLDAEVDYSCDTWSPDESVFQRPSDIEFLDLKMMMQGGMMGR